MKCIVIHKVKVITAVYVFLSVFVAAGLSFSTIAKVVPAGSFNAPLLNVKTDENAVCLTFNVYEHTDISKLIEAIGVKEATFFINEEYQDAYPDKVKDLAELGHHIGILEENMQGESENEIRDRLAVRIERMARLTGKNADMVRLTEDGIDEDLTKTIYSLGLLPVQWSEDEVTGHFKRGDIILADEKTAEAFIEKISADGFEIISAKNLFL